MVAEFLPHTGAATVFIVAFILVALFLGPLMAYSQTFSNMSTPEGASTEQDSLQGLETSSATSTPEGASTEQDSLQGLETSAITINPEGNDYVTTYNYENPDSSDTLAETLGVTSQDRSSNEGMEGNIKNEVLSQSGRISQEDCGNNGDNINGQVVYECNPPPPQPICPAGTHLGGTKGVQCVPDNPPP